MRRIIQLAVLVAIVFVALTGRNVEYFCPAGGLASFAGFFLENRMSCSMGAINIFMFFAVLAAVVLAGKLFCAFLCPLGTVSEALGAAGAKAHLGKPLHGATDKVLRAGKYAMLFLVLHETFKSSELLCRRFDPYYALASGFDHEIVLWAAALALALLFIGSFALRLFWCKYLCFFGAAQNSVATVIGAAAAIIYGIACSAGLLPLSLPLLFGLLCGFGFVGELVGQRWLPLFRVARVDDPCTQCGRCDRACPQGIPVTAYTKMTHPDCFLCGACVDTCPAKGAMVYRPFGNRWLAPVLMVVLFTGAWLASGRVGETSTFATLRHVPAGLAVDGKTVAVHERAGVKNIKCYGSALAFLSRLGNRKKGGGFDWKNGILGAETYASTKRFRIFYDPRTTTASKIDALVFKAGKVAVKAVASIDPTDPAETSVCRVGVFGLLDDIDVYGLSLRLAKSPHVFGFSTLFGEPVTADVHYDGKRIDPAAIVKLIQDKTPIKYGQQEMPFLFEVHDPPKPQPSVPTARFIRAWFPALDRWIRPRTAYIGRHLDVLELRLDKMDHPRMRIQHYWLTMHLGQLAGVARMRTVLREETDGKTGKRRFSARAWIYFDGTQTKAAAIEAAAKAPRLLLRAKPKPFEKANPFRLLAPAKLIDPTIVAREGR